MAAGAVVFRRADAVDAVKYLTHGGCAGFGEILTADHVTRASMFKYVVFTRITQPVADHGQGIFFWCGRGLQRPAVISQRFYLQSAAVQQLLQAALDVVIAVQAVALLAARQAGVNREGKSAVCGILIERFIERSRAILTCAAKAENERPASGSRLRRMALTKGVVLRKRVTASYLPHHHFCCVQL